MSKAPNKTSAVRQRIVETAERLFYAEGFRAVGIDRIIAEAGVAKMSLYNHFRSKDDLIVAALQYRAEKFDSMLEAAMEQHVQAGLDRLQAFFAALKSWFESPGFRGSMFINVPAELADPQHEGALFSARHNQRFRDLQKQLITEAAGAKAAKAMAPAIALLVEGAVVSVVMEQSSQAADVARVAAMALLAPYKKR